MQQGPLPHSSTGLLVREITLVDVERLQAFFVENPDYFHIVHGCAPQPDEARDEIDDRLSEGWSFTRKWKIGYFDGTGALVAMVSIVSDLLAPGVWNMGLFMVASSLRGRGIARQLHRELEDWAAGMGARWLRLSVVFANVRAEGFWRACGYVEARTRDGIELGQLRHRVRIMIKPLSWNGSQRRVKPLGHELKSLSPVPWGHL
ncbi:GNAT family N-acetyltransferase [Pseudomonas protegens]|uniref:GNAT family N-acetyltransferase n=1 Tax=Pseudomonas protegens TaxID=380021 RepID=UPI00276CAEE0|nr:GNAT family N-acetyltransferase [Pseudomonas protegens]MDP9512340.1 GNAT family N-acetyltransferase [Pseudomonas protegens]